MIRSKIDGHIATISAPLHSTIHNDEVRERAAACGGDGGWLNVSCFVGYCPLLVAARYRPSGRMNEGPNEQTTFHIRRQWGSWWRLSSILILKVIKATQSHFHMNPPPELRLQTEEEAREQIALTIKRFNRDSRNLLTRIVGSEMVILSKIVPLLLLLLSLLSSPPEADRDNDNVQLPFQHS